jgi:DNA-binding transcriptional regulator of glucitol operon
MSTEIKNTLFRFVSMRAPELISDFQENPNFILQADADKGIFNEVIDVLPAGNSKLNALATAANNFVDSAKDFEDVKSLNEELFVFSVWLAKNKSTATEAELLVEKNKIVDASIDLIIVWENLFYQVITQKDFYVKEVLMQLLVAKHVVSNARGDLKVKANAKVVLPEKLFIEDSTAESSASGERTASTSPSFVDPILSVHEKQALAEDNISGLTQLKKELKDVESIYQQEYQAAYTTAYNQYLEDIQPIIDQYNEDVTTANNTWCTIRDPEMPIAGNDPCKQPPVVPQPKIPEFVFTHKGPLDKAFLSEHLSENSYKVYLGLINTRPVDPEINDNLRLPNNLTTFNSLESSLTELIDHENDTIASVAVDNGASTLLIGGATISVPNSGTNLQPF